MLNNKEKILINITNLSDVETYKKVGITNFLFPVKDYSVGYNSFTLKEIESTASTAYLLMNRLLTDEDIDAFLELKLPKNVKGLFIEDTGLYYALKDCSLELINFQNHLNNNYKTVNFWLKYFDSLVVSTDITAEEVKEILSQCTKPLVIYTFGYPQIMYSRRNLLSNYHAFRKEKPKTLEHFTIPNGNLSLTFKENDRGTVVYPNRPLDGREKVEEYDEDKIKFYVVDTNMLDTSTVLSVLKGERIDKTSIGFLEQKTIYRVGDIK
ncbi:MAG TPA: hypothetical protein DCY94_01300 [Firmicutes bacterium]|nr:hypothetical protein [Bacillota bacterium]